MRWLSQASIIIRWRTSATMMNKKGERGSPCRKPFLHWIQGPGEPFRRIADVTPNVVAKSIVSKVNQRNTRKYIVPARRNGKKKQATVVHCSNQGVELRDHFLHYGKTTAHIFIGDVPVQLVAPDNVEPRFRTPCMQNHLREHTKE